MHRVTQLFADEARRFVAWATGAPDPSPMTASVALRRLVALYAAGLALSDGAPASSSSSSSVSRDEPAGVLRVVAERVAALPVGYYGSLLHPLTVPPGEAGVGDLADDLVDVFGDVAHGLRLFDLGHVDDALWSWRFHLWAHWGEHATSAIHVLHRFVANELVDAPAGEPAPR